MAQEGALQGKTVLITGAARGIGRELTLAMAAAGADLALTSRRPSDLEEVARRARECGVQVSTHALDLTVRNRSQVETVVAEVEAGLGFIDTLVCNSGVGGPSGPLWAVTDAEWDEVLAVNLTGVFLSIRAVLPQMVREGQGSVIIIGSMTGKAPLFNRAPYAASKMALVGLCRTLAADVGAHGVRANIISPGFVQGPRLDWVIQSRASALGLTTAEIQADLRARSPLNRFTTEADVAAAAIFLASDAASAITGEDLNVSSGTVMY
jgi:NAD(P)-dependent dehydrogenase (short-subunit alcohol dehydrogenase family)